MLVVLRKMIVEALSYHVKLVTRCWLLFSKSASPYKMCYAGHIRLDEPQQQQYVNTTLTSAIVFCFVISDCQCDPRSMLSGDSPYHGESYVCDMSLGLCCAGVELGCGDRRQGEGQEGRAVPTDQER
jgi:hypothetical protein